MERLAFRMEHHLNQVGWERLRTWLATGPEPTWAAIVTQASNIWRQQQLEELEGGMPWSRSPSPDPDSYFPIDALPNITPGLKIAWYTN